MPRPLVEFVGLCGLDHSVEIQQLPPTESDLMNPEYTHFSSANSSSSSSSSSSIPPLLAAYKGAVLSHYPPRYESINIQSLPLFCLPQAIKFTKKRKNNSNTNTTTSNPIPQPLFYSFQNTLEDGTVLHGACLLFYEPLSPDSDVFMYLKILSDIYLMESSSSPPSTSGNNKGSSVRKGGGKKGTGDDGDIGNNQSYSVSDFVVGMGDEVFVPKSLCLISPYPFFSSFEGVLRYLHSNYCLYYGNGNNNNNNNNRNSLSSSAFPVSSLFLETAVALLVHCVAAPEMGRRMEYVLEDGVSGGMGEEDKEKDQRKGSILFEMPRVDDLPLLDFSLRACLDAVGGLDNFLILFRCALIERRIVVYARDMYKLSLVIESLSCMLYPFRWRHVYVPVLPKSLNHFLEAPVPYILGVYHDVCVPGELREQVVFMDMENQEIHVPHSDPIPRLPRLIHNSLHSRLVDILEKYDGLGDSKSGMKRGTLVSGSGRRREVEGDGDNGELNKEIRIAFLDCFVSILDGFQDFIIPLKKKQQASNTSTVKVAVSSADSAKSATGGNMGELDEGEEEGAFDNVGFLSDLLAEDRSFVGPFLETQCFACFIDEWREGHRPLLFNKRIRQLQMKTNYLRTPSETGAGLVSKTSALGNGIVPNPEEPNGIKSVSSLGSVTQNKEWSSQVDATALGVLKKMTISGANGVQLVLRREVIENLCNVLKLPELSHWDKRKASLFAMCNDLSAQQVSTSPTGMSLGASPSFDEQRRLSRTRSIGSSLSMDSSFLKTQSEFRQMLLEELEEIVNRLASLHLKSFDSAYHGAIDEMKKISIVEERTSESVESAEKEEALKPCRLVDQKNSPSVPVSENVSTDGSQSVESGNQESVSKGSDDIHVQTSESRRRSRSKSNSSTKGNLTQLSELSYSQQSLTSNTSDLNAYLSEFNRAWSKRHEGLVTLLCLLFDRIWSHGLRSNYRLMYGKDVFWKNLEQYGKDIDCDIVQSIPSLKSNVSLGRAWVRLALERKVLCKHLDFVCHENSLDDSTYHDYAFLRNVHCQRAMLRSLALLSNMDFRDFTSQDYNRTLMEEVHDGKRSTSRSSSIIDVRTGSPLPFELGRESLRIKGHRSNSSFGSTGAAHAAFNRSNSTSRSHRKLMSGGDGGKTKSGHWSLSSAEGELLQHATWTSGTIDSGSVSPQADARGNKKERDTNQSTSSSSRIWNLFSRPIKSDLSGNQQVAGHGGGGVGINAVVADADSNTGEVSQTFMFQEDDVDTFSPEFETSPPGTAQRPSYVQASPQSMTMGGRLSPFTGNNEAGSGGAAGLVGDFEDEEFEDGADRVRVLMHELSMERSRAESMRSDCKTNRSEIRRLKSQVRDLELKAKRDVDAVNIAAEKQVNELTTNHQAAMKKVTEGYVQEIEILKKSREERLNQFREVFNRSSQEAIARERSLKNELVLSDANVRALQAKVDELSAEIENLKRS
eukprot:Nk52_evm13s2325 gene=Nk52_evmTU13s2325